MRARIERAYIPTFYAAYSLILAASLLGHIDIIGPYIRILRYFAYLALIFYCIINLYHATAKQRAIAAGLVVFAAIIGINSEEFGILRLLIVSGVAYKLTLRQIVVFDVTLRLILIPTVMLLSAIGLTHEIDFYAHNGFGRYSLGFTNPNLLGMHMALLILGVLYLESMKLTRKSIIAFTLSIIFLSYFSISRTALAIVVLALLLSVVNTIDKRIFKSNVFTSVLAISPIVLSLLFITALAAFTRYDPWAIRLDETLTYRLSHAALYFAQVDVNLFGNPIPDTGFVVDGFYPYLVLGLGAVSAVIFFIAFPLFVTASKRKGEIALLLVTVCLLVYGLSERQWIYIDYNLILVAFAIMVKKEDILHLVNIDQRADASTEHGSDPYLLSCELE